jgi:adenylate cyclase
MAALELEIYKGDVYRGGWVVDGPVQLGRQLRESDPLLKLQDAPSGVRRLAVAGGDLTAMSRLHALVEPLDNNRVRITNQSERLLLTLAQAREPPIQPGQQRELDLNDRQVVRLGDSDVTVRLGRPDSGLHSLPDVTRPPGSAVLPAGARPGGIEALANFDLVLNWLNGTLDLLQPGTAEETYHNAAQAVVDVLGLDRGVVVLREGEALEVKASAPRGKDDRKPGFSRRVVDRTFQFGKAFFGPPWALEGSTAELALVAAAPLKDASGEVVGVLYGEGRGALVGPPTADVARVKAALLEVLARATAGTLAQREMSRLTQYLSPGQAREVLRPGKWERGQEVIVTVLFCDIRDFTKITSSITRTDRMVAWCRDVLGLLLGCVRKHEGTLIDYTGDGLFALWGAPVEMHDHANRACAAALDMLDGLAGIDAEWESKIRRKTQVRIGLNTGKARVGNVGTRDMPKFGAQGAVVNVGKRIESACKVFQCRAMMHASTQGHLTVSTPVRKLGTICPVGVDLKDSFDVYELAPPGNTHLPEWRETYEEALAAFSSGEPEAIADVVWRLADWRKEHPEDLPGLALLRRIIDLALNPGGKLPDEHPVWILHDK